MSSGNVHSGYAHFSTEAHMSVMAAAQRTTSSGRMPKNWAAVQRGQREVGGDAEEDTG